MLDSFAELEYIMAAFLRFLILFPGLFSNQIVSQTKVEKCERTSQCIFHCVQMGKVFDLTPFKRNDSKPV